MKFSLAAVLLAAASLVSAEDFSVLVGKSANGTNTIVYTPNQIKAKVGDRINFEFHFKNHTVTQSSFAQPCTRQRNTVTNELGVDSGFMPIPTNPAPTEIPVWTIEVKQDTSPIWLFCNQVNHCNGGMVFAINAPDTGNKTFAAFLEKAKTANHPDPALGETADFTPPPAQGSAPPSGSDAPSSSDPSAPTGSDSTAAPAESSAVATDAAAPSDTASTPAAGATTPPAAADQANVSSAAPPTSTKPSGALSAVRVPGAGIALTLAGLLAGMLL